MSDTRLTEEYSHNYFNNTNNIYLCYDLLTFYKAI